MSKREKTVGAYGAGFIICLVLTLVAFALVGFRMLDSSNAYVLLSALAIAQLVTQSICFLRLSTDRDGLWDLMPFVFVLIVVSILVGGSLWIMYNLNYNMMTH